ncbi:DUF547 domain-containing protein [Poritiphilus flavus]|uniref:DUF547 domain-containing protein n=1 Tax=Poritiphilus flavus TaxID=2697053 RepID=A0A6L9EDT6_9FLAO|nr:DUF547 domain-containing protein [Poritiphilus flavus]NAS12792.1 DUF547 domain-containing protein [Poritiphilus flavus]
MRILLVLMAFLSFLPGSEAAYSWEMPANAQATEELDHTAWDKLLKKYVSADGNVVYTKFKEDLPALTDYLKYLGANEPAETASANERLAFYINLYNAATVKLILDNYPVSSIKEIKAPWATKWIQLGDRKISLGQIEHKILRKMGEPRIHFAINCASYSCPKLLNEAFTSGKMEQQLAEVTRSFIEDKSRNVIGEDTLQLSEIFKWYKKDFTASGTLIDYLEANGSGPIQPKTKIEYLKYDWSLNEAKKFSAY